MFFFINISGGQSSWASAPLILLLPFILNGGLFELLFDLLYTVTYPVLSLLGLSSHPEDSILLALVQAAVPLVLAYVLYKAILRSGHRFTWQGLRRLLLQGFTGQAGNGRHHQQRAGPPRQARATIDTVSATLQKLPTEDYMHQEELQKLSTHDLKRRLANLRISTEGLLEKQELISLLTAAGGSSSTSCSICFEDYCSGDACRVLPCRHRFHIECVDKWFYSSTDYTRPPACPLCNTELLQPTAQPASR